jgi:MOSC domain-containing protein YiiM
VATLIAVNVGMPKDVVRHGETIRIGVWKNPWRARDGAVAQSGRRRARRSSGHGGEQRAVLVYQLDSYRHWQEHMKRDDFTYGQVGENFTVDGLADDEVCIGDRYQIGGAVFEVRRSSTRRTASGSTPSRWAWCAPR